MCGIIGIVSDSAVSERLLDGLKRLEYRGYDSAGIATVHDGVIDRRRAEGKLANLAADWASDRISRGEWDAARATLLSREQSLRRRVEASRRGHDLDGLPDPLRTAWPALPLHRRRAIIGALVEAVVVGPGVRGRNRFDPERVSIRWKV